MKAKICGIKDKITLKYLTSHPYAPKFIGFICNYKKSKRFIELDDLKKILKIEKKQSKYVAVLVKPTEVELLKISKLPFDYYQIYDMTPDEIKLIKEKYKINIIVAITVKDKEDVLAYKNYINVADIILFDSKGYEKSMSFDHKLVKDIKTNIEVMLAGNMQIDDDLEKYNKITDIIDISGGLETSGLKDISKINIFLNKIKKINNET
jgi:phosphoribosylanthranilate isomerase